MAKSARATSFKRNSVTRRDNVYKPVFDASLKRLSDKLLAIAEADLPTESTNPVKKADPEAMEVVEEGDKAAEPAPLSTYKKRSQKGKVSRHRHARNSVLFPSLRKGTKANNKTKNKK